MLKPKLTRRHFVAAAAGALALPFSGSAQQNVFGRIAFIKDGNIMQWSSDGVTTLHEDGAAMAPTWQPDTTTLMYVRKGGSFSNLVELETETGRTRRLTNSESSEQPGSQAYVEGSDWIADPFWSESGIVVFASTADDPNTQLGLWILRYNSNTMFVAPTDFGDTGPCEKITVGANGRYACYTVTGEDLVSSYIGMRDLDTGETWRVMEGINGAYDGAVSPNGRWVIGTIRDSEGDNDLWLSNVETSETVRLTQGEQASAVTWDYFGEAVAYLAYVDGGFSLRSFRVDFTGDEPRIDGDIQVLIERDNIDSTSRLSWAR